MASHHATPTEYLEFDRSSTLKNEYLRGEIFAMAGGSPDHGSIASNVIGALWGRLRGKGCRVFDSDVRLAVDPKSAYSYADGFVVCGKPEYVDEKRDTITNPRLAIEVLSPSTRNYDLGDKTRLYLQIDSLTDLLLIEQDRVWIEHWFRRPGGEWNRKVYVSLADALCIESLECEIPVAEIYDQIDLSGART